LPLPAISFAAAKLAIKMPALLLEIACGVPEESPVPNTFVSRTLLAFRTIIWPRIPTRETPLFDLLIVPLLALHLLCVNVAAAGPLASIFFEWKEGRGDALAGRTASYLGLAALVTLLVGGLLGLAIGALSWDDRFATVWTTTMSYKARWGVGEVVFSLLLAVAYVALRRTPTRLRWLRNLMLFLSGSNLLYHFPFLFTVASDMVLTSDKPGPMSASEFRSWMMHPDVLARVAHVMLASFAATGVLLIGFGMRLKRQQDVAPDEAQRVVRWGGWLALIPSMLQVPVGLWLIAALPGDWQARLVGGDVPAIGMFAVSILLAFFLLQDLASIAFGEVARKHQVRSMALLVLVVLLMTGVLRRIRPVEPLVLPITVSNEINPLPPPPPSP
jgi:hypothetical protein